MRIFIAGVIADGSHGTSRSRRANHDSLRRCGALLHPFAKPLSELVVRERRFRAVVARFDKAVAWTKKNAPEDPESL
jgi:hypothetical protein